MCVMTSVTGKFLNKGKRGSFEADDFLLFPADVEHRFESFGDWVILHDKNG